MNALRSFEAAARHLSMTRAASELAVTQGAVSRQVAKLEEEIGIRLFYRDHRRLRLTREGAEYYAIIHATFEQMYAAHGNFVRRLNQNTLKVRLPPTFAIRWFISRLHRLHALHPTIEVQITTSHQAVDFSDDNVDVAIWSTVRPDGNFRRIRLFGELLIPVCSPRLVEAGPPLDMPDDLSRHTLLHSMQRPEDWPRWLEAVGANAVRSDTGMRFENSNLAYQAALEGAGVALAQFRLIQEDLRYGRLLTPFPVPIKAARIYYLIVPAAESRSPKIRKFRQWLHSELVRDKAEAQRLSQSLVAAPAAGRAVRTTASSAAAPG